MIGRTVWFFDLNRRVYRDRKIVFREHFVPAVIVDHTKTSWITDYYGRKINKKTLMTRPAYGLQARVFMCSADVDDAVFVDENRYRIVEAVRECTDADMLRTFARMLGVGPS